MLLLFTVPYYTIHTPQDDTVLSGVSLLVCYVVISRLCAVVTTATLGVLATRYLLSPTVSHGTLDQVLVTVPRVPIQLLVCCCLSIVLVYMYTVGMSMLYRVIDTMIHLQYCKVSMRER